jgi:hypothetical protein
MPLPLTVFTCGQGNDGNQFHIRPDRADPRCCHTVEAHRKARIFSRAVSYHGRDLLPCDRTGHAVAGQIAYQALGVRGGLLPLDPIEIGPSLGYAESLSAWLDTFVTEPRMRGFDRVRLGRRSSAWKMALSPAFLFHRSMRDRPLGTMNAWIRSAWIRLSSKPLASCICTCTAPIH